MKKVLKVAGVQEYEYDWLVGEAALIRHWGGDEARGDFTQKRVGGCDYGPPTREALCSGIGA